MISDKRDKLNILLAAVADGNADCLDGIYVFAGGQMFAVAMSILHDRVLAEDAVHDSLIKIAKKAHKYKPGTSASAWIMTIVHNTALDMVKKRKHEISAVEIFNLSSYDYSFDKAENAITFEMALRKLNDTERKIIYCRYYLDMTVRETADALKMSKSNVQRIQERAEDKVKHELGGTNDGNESL